MRYDGDDTCEDFRAWQRAFAAKLRELRGEPLPRPTPPGVRLLASTELDDHVRQHVAIESVLGTTVPAYVLVPKGARGRRPAVMALHGHGVGGKERLAGTMPAPAGGAPSSYALAAVGAGFVTLTLDWWGWGERAEGGFDFGGRDMCNVKFMAAGMYGVWLLSIMLSDAAAALEALRARADVDPDRVAAMGNSFGGRMSMYLAALDERIAAAVCSGCLNCFRERSLKLTSCGAQFFPGLLAQGDVQEVFALIAPRPLMILSGAKDPLLPDEYVRRMKPVIQRAYRALGAEEKLTFHDHDGGHVLPTAPAVEWLRRQLGP
jgi:dienelactone hydrolase